MFIKLNNNDYYAYTANHEPDPELETIIFVHGTSMDHSVWSHQSRYFAYHQYNVLGLDLPGHNLSGGQLLTQIEDMADWLNEIIAHSIGTRIHLVGHSQGSLICLQAASVYNSLNAQLSSLSLVGFSYPMSVAPVLMDAARDNPQAAFSMMTQWSHQSVIGGEPVPGFWSPGMQMSMMSNNDPQAVYVDLQACHNYSNGEKAIAEVDCPTLFLCGALDKMAPAKLAKQHAAQHQNAEIVMLPNCGHALMSESPDGVLNELKRFIALHSG